MAYSSEFKSCEISASLASGAARRVVLLRRLCGATSAAAQAAKVVTRHMVAVCRPDDRCGVAPSLEFLPQLPRRS